MRRREFIMGLGMAAVLPSAVWPMVACAQQTRKIGLFAGGADGEAASAAFTEALAKVGWIEGRNIDITRRFDTDDDRRMRTYAAEIIARSPDVIVSTGTQMTAILKQQVGTTPIVFVNVADPVASGFVASFNRPGGNVTGFTSNEFSLAGKWVSILKDIAPDISNVIVLYDPSNSSSEGYLQTLSAASLALKIAIRAAPAADIGAIERHIESFAHEPGAGMIALPDGLTIVNREAIAALAVRYRLPAMYPFKFYASSGGLASYGSDFIDLFRRAAQYVDRILRGENVGDLPVQAPTKFEFVLNLKAAKALGLTIPVTLLATADEVIQ
jgi:putative ABC transport system substrate-binding protein